MSLHGLFNASVPTAQLAPELDRELLYKFATPRPGLGVKKGGGAEVEAAPAAPPAPEATAAAVTVSSFVTPQSLLSFPGAVLASQGIWAVLRSIFPAQLSGLWVPGVIGFLLGLGIMFYSLSDPNLATSGRDRIWGYVVGVVNSIFLSGAAMGVIAVGVGGGSNG